MWLRSDIACPFCGRIPQETGFQAALSDADRYANLRSAKTLYQYPRQGLNYPQESLGKCESCDDATRQTARISWNATSADPRLKQIIESWSTLPEALRAGIVAMIAANRTVHSRAENAQGGK
jgi:hypothetical protein